MQMHDTERVDDGEDPFVMTPHPSTDQGDTLFEAIHSLVTSVTHIPLPVDEPSFMRMLVASVDSVPDELARKRLQSTSGLTGQHNTTLQLRHLPLLARAIQQTIGVVDGHGELVRVPHQWIQTTPHVVHNRASDEDHHAGTLGLSGEEWDDEVVHDIDTLEHPFDRQQDIRAEDYAAAHQQEQQEHQEHQDSDPPETAVVYRMLPSGKYTLDYDADYIERYVHKATVEPEKWTIHTDTEHIILGGTARSEESTPTGRGVGSGLDSKQTQQTPSLGRGARNSVGNNTAPSVSTRTTNSSLVRDWHSSTQFSVANAIGAFKTSVTLQKRFATMWGKNWRFPFEAGTGGVGDAHHCEASSTQHVPTYPPVTEREHFHARLFCSPELRFPQMVVAAGSAVPGQGHEPHSAHNTTPFTSQTEPQVTFKTHQQFVRTFFSPLTPYHSMLLVHSTGSGKTFTTFGITEAFREYVRFQNKTIHIACPRLEVRDEFRSYLTVDSDLRNDGQMLQRQEGGGWGGGGGGGDTRNIMLVTDDTTPQSSPNTPREYIRSVYKEDSREMYNEVSSQVTFPAKHTYTIDTYRRIFPNRVREVIHAVQALYMAWFHIFPAWSSVERVASGFVLRADALDSPADVQRLRQSLGALSRTVADVIPDLLGTEPWMYKVEDNVCHSRSRGDDVHRTGGGAKGELVVSVSGAASLDAFEHSLLLQYADTLFVIDEAHNFTDTASNTTAAATAASMTSRQPPAPATDQPFTDATLAGETNQQHVGGNWRAILRVIICILRHHHKRMRLLLLSATPMTNGVSDLVELVNLMIENDAWEHEALLPISRSMDWSLLARRMQGRVSYYSSTDGKPTELAPEDVYFALPAKSTIVRVARGKALDVLCVSDMDQFVRALHSPAFGVSVVCWDWRTYDRTHPEKHGIPAKVLGESLVDVGGGRRTPHCQQYVCVVLGNVGVGLRTLPVSKQDVLLAHFGTLLQPHHTVFFVTSSTSKDVEAATIFANRVDVARCIYQNTSRRRPLWWDVGSARVHSMHHSPEHPPTLYSPSLGNMHAFVRQYLSNPHLLQRGGGNNSSSSSSSTSRTPPKKTKAATKSKPKASSHPSTATSAAVDHHTPPPPSSLYHHFPSIVATPIRADALLDTDPTTNLPYQFGSRLISNWNRSDPTLTAYHPKIDTMLSMIEELPGNSFIFINKEGVRLDKDGSQTLRFLRNCILKRFRGCSSSRLRNVHVELLHKETLLGDQLQRASHAVAPHGTGSGTGALPIALHRRLQMLNDTLLAKRDDVILVGSTEVMEGLTMDEVRQVHILEPSWNMANMQQVIGRAVRIKNHKKHRRRELHSVVCCVHVAVPDEPEVCFRYQRKQLQRALDAGVYLSRAITHPTTPVLARQVGDLHRYFFVQQKLRGIRRAVQEIRKCAVDAVLQPIETQRRVCVLAESDSNMANCTWRVLKTSVVSAPIVETVQSMRRALSETACATPHPPPTPVPLLPASRESYRSEIDWLKQEVVSLFAHAAVPVRSFEELLREVEPSGVFAEVGGVTKLTGRGLPLKLSLAHYVERVRQECHPKRQTNTITTNTNTNTPRTPDAVYTISQATHATSSSAQALVQWVTGLDRTPATESITRELLQDLMFVEYKWMVTRPPTSSPNTLHIRVDPQSVLEHPSWVCSPPASSLEKLASRVTPEKRAALCQLQKTWTIPTHSALLEPLLHSSDQLEIVAAAVPPREHSLRNDSSTLPTSTKRSRRRRRRAAGAIRLSTDGIQIHNSTSGTKRRATRPHSPDTTTTTTTTKKHKPGLSPPTLPPNWRPGLCLQTVREEALSFALDELVTAHQPIVRAEGVVCVLVRVGANRYTTRRMDMPPSAALWGVPIGATDGTGLEDEEGGGGGLVVAPYSIPTSANSLFQESELEVVIQNFFVTVEQLLRAVDSVQTNITAQQLRLYTVEHVFDRMSLTQQQQALHYMAVHGVDGRVIVDHAPSPGDVPLLRQAVQHRFVEKGAKATDCFPPSAVDILQRCFPKGGAGRVYMSFARDPSTQNCQIHQYNNTQTKGKQQQRVPYTHHSIPNADAHRHAAAYFSPTPVLQPGPEYLFESNPRVPTASTSPITPQSPVFAYNRVFNHTFVRANYLHDPQICIGQELRDVPLLTEEVLQKLEELRHTGVLPCPFQKSSSVQQCEEKIRSAFRAQLDTAAMTCDDSIDSTCDDAHQQIQINVSHYVRYLWLRHVGMYARFFYPYVIARHPSGPHYAEYRMTPLHPGAHM